MSNTLTYIVLGIFIVIVAFSIIRNKKRKSELEINEDSYEYGFNIKHDFYPYVSRDVLTKEEQGFYRDLKPIAEKYGYCILAKLKIADIVQVTENSNRDEWQKYFGKISSRHIDFALCDSENLKVKLLIDLDESTHKLDKVKQREELTQRILNIAGYKLLSVQNSEDIENKINEILNG